MGRTSTCSSSTNRRPGAQIQMGGRRRRVFVGEAQAEGEVVVRFPSRPCTATARVRLIPPSPPPQRRVLQAYDRAATQAGAELVRPSHAFASKSAYLELLQNASAPI
ncbi:hypothetical protein BDA96_04G210200 [Sorghum bicolor]|uniref:Uncharacterized protein n=2 Tax=Sorghum bicolor TaxID=4558 RepID=A0A921R4Y0_SORBI|nr:hypothetical protein BDA96_04G210200 [Sorghum bicolor]KXG30529.1 hypothetical protein SORBI_3004G197900 [Sorghum bicolor]